MTVRINFNIECNTDEETIKRNCDKSEKYPRVKYVNPLAVLTKPPAAVVGGGPGAALSLDILRQWPGDIFAVNDTAGYLSDNGVPNYLFSIDCSRIPYKIGPLTKGALLASRCHRRQYAMFEKSQIMKFDLAEDFRGGATGGPTGVCRAAILLLRLGYQQVHYFGCEGSFSDLSQTHVSGNQKVAYENLIIVRAGELEYVTNSSLLVQSEYMMKVFAKFPQYLVCRSGGLIRALIDNPEDWEVKAVAEDLKRQFERKGQFVFTKDYRAEDHRIWH